MGRALDNAGVSPRGLGNIIGIGRTFPIRVGNTEGGFSGPVYDNQKEFTWHQISQIAGKSVREFTTVTKRERRVFNFSREQMMRFVQMVRPHHMCINFMDYLPEAQHRKWMEDLSSLMLPFDCRLSYIGTGPGMDDYKEL